MLEATIAFKHPPVDASGEPAEEGEVDVDRG